MNASPFPLVVGNGGLRGQLETDISGSGPLPALLLIRLEGGQQMQVPKALLTAREDGTYFIPLTLSELEAAVGSSVHPENAAITMPIMAETLQVGTRTVETGVVRFHKTVQEQEQVVDEPLQRSEVTVERVAVNRVCEGAAPAVRNEGDTLIIPVLEEVLVVSKRLMLKEEIHVRREQSTFHAPQHVTLRHEEVSVERVAAPEGSVGAAGS